MNGSRFGASLPLLLTLCAPAMARPHPQLTPEAAALFKGTSALVLPTDNLAVSLTSDHRAVALVAPRPAQLVLVADTDAPLLAVDGELYRIANGHLSRAGGAVGRAPSASRDGAVVASLADPHSLTIERAGHVVAVAYKRLVASQWELVRPWVAPDGSSVLVTVRDYTQSLDTFDLVVIDAATGAFEEVHLRSKNFAPGELRQSLDATHVLVDLYLQQSDAAGFIELRETDSIVFDLKNHTFSTVPAGLRLGRSVAGGPYSWRRGKMIFSDDKRCGGDRTLLYQEGKPLPARLATGGDELVSVVDVWPSSNALIVNVLSPKTCKNHGALVPLVGDDQVNKWAPFPLPLRGGPIDGRIFMPSVAP